MAPYSKKIILKTALCTRINNGTKTRTNVELTKHKNAPKHRRDIKQEEKLANCGRIYQISVGESDQSTE